MEDAGIDRLRPLTQEVAVRYKQQLVAPGYLLARFTQLTWHEARCGCANSRQRRRSRHLRSFSSPPSHVMLGNRPRILAPVHEQLECLGGMRDAKPGVVCSTLVRQLTGERGVDIEAHHVAEDVRQHPMPLRRLQRAVGLADEV